MEKHAWNLFPTPVNYFKGVLSNEQLATIYQYCIDLEAQVHGAFVGQNKSNFARSARLLKDLEARFPNLAGLHKGLSLLVNDYGKELGFENLSITNSWCNVQYPGSLLKHHTHPDSKISGALCIQSDEKSSKLFLENPNTIVNLVRSEKPTAATFEFAQFKLNSGDLLLFPSWIKHGSGFEMNQSDTRVMISFNANSTA